MTVLVEVGLVNVPDPESRDQVGHHVAGGNGPEGASESVVDRAVMRDPQQVIDRGDDIAGDKRVVGGSSRGESHLGSIFLGR